MDKDLEKKLLKVIKENLNSANVTAIEDIINDNRRLNEEVEVISKERAEARKLCLSSREEVKELSEKLVMYVNIESREEVLKIKETKHEELIAKHEKVIVEIELKEVKASRSELQGLMQTLFQNKQISHFISTSGNMPVYNPQGFATQEPFNSSSTKTEDN